VGNSCLGMAGDGMVEGMPEGINGCGLFVVCLGCTFLCVQAAISYSSLSGNSSHQDKYIVQSLGLLLSVLSGLSHPLLYCCTKMRQRILYRWG
jgi:hypothetical protein